MTAKPIAVIYFPAEIGGKQITMTDCNRIMAFLERDKPDYYWFAFPEYDITSPTFKVFYEKDFTDIQYEELKNMVAQAIEKNKSDDK